MSKMTLAAFAELINAADEWKTEFSSVIEENGWVDKTGEEYGICESETAVLEYDERGVAVVRMKMRARLGEELFQLRREKGLSLRQLAELSGVSWMTIHRMESGQHGTSTEVFDKVLSAMGARLEIVSE